VLQSCVAITTIQLKSICITPKRFLVSISSHLNILLSLKIIEKLKSPEENKFPGQKLNTSICYNDEEKAAVLGNSKQGWRAGCVWVSGCHGLHSVTSEGKL
jgi:hypothetical protein